MSTNNDLPDSVSDEHPEEEYRRALAAILQSAADRDEYEHAADALAQCLAKLIVAVDNTMFFAEVLRRLSSYVCGSSELYGKKSRLQ